MTLSLHPLILTLKLDDHSLELLDRLRRQYFPPQRNLLKAHLTLFHALPGVHQMHCEKRLRELCATTAPLSLILPGPRLLGRGVAFEVECPPLVNLREDLAAEWEQWLTPQDRQAYEPHVTIQNKVKPEEASRLFEYLAAVWEPLQAKGAGLLLWKYLGGPWELLSEFLFKDRKEAR